MTPQYPSENDCFADDGVEDAEKKLTSHCCQYQSEATAFQLQFADDIDLIETVKKNNNNSLKAKLEKTVACYRMEMVLGKTLEEVDQLKYLGSTQTKHGTSMKEVRIRWAQARLW